MKNIYLYSHYDFLIEIDNNNYFLDKTKNIEIVDYDFNKIIKVYPVNGNNLSIPFCIKFDIKENNLICNSTFIKIYNFCDRYEVFIYPFKIFSNFCILNKKINILNNNYFICCYNDRIKITNNFNEYIYEINANNFIVDKKENNIFIMCENKIKHLIVFNTQKNVFYEINGNKIEINNNNIKSLKYFNDSFNHITLTTFNLKNNCEILNTELFTNNNNNILYKNNYLIPINLFDLIKLKNFKNTNLVLSPVLLESLNENTLTSFFGDFLSFNLKSLDPLIYTLYYENTAKDFKFFVKDNLIFDIEEI